MRMKDSNKKEDLKKFFYGGNSVSIKESLLGKKGRENFSNANRMGLLSAADPKNEFVSNRMPNQAKKISVEWEKER